MRTATVAILLAALVPAVPASAQEGDARAQAEQRFQRGLVLMETEDWAAAALEFDRSIELHPTRAAVFNLAMCRKAQHDYPAAVATFQRFLREFRDQADAEQLRIALDQIDQLGSLLANLTVTVDVAGADVLVDGRSVGTAPLAAPIVVASGPHAVEARLEGRPTASRQVEVASGENAVVSLAFAPATIGPVAPIEPVAPPPPETGFVVLQTGLSEGETVLVFEAEEETIVYSVPPDGSDPQQVCVTPCRISVPNGDHEFEIDGVAGEEFSVSARGGTQTWELDTGNRPAFGFGIAGVVVGSLLTIGLGGVGGGLGAEGHNEVCDDADYDDDTCLGIFLGTGLGIGLPMIGFGIWGIVAGDADTELSSTEAPASPAVAVVPGLLSVRTEDGQRFWGMNLAVQF